MADSEERSPRFFYGLQPRWSGDRLYRVYVSDRMLAGAYVAGQFYDEQSTALQLQWASLLLRPLIRRLLAQRQERETLYDALDPFEPSLLDHDPRNFQALRTDVARTRVRRNRSLWTPFNGGTVALEFLDGTTRRFILVGDEEPDVVLRLMQRFDPATEVTGKPNPRPRSKRMSRAGKRRMWVLLACILWGFAVLFSFTAWAGIAPDAVHIPLAVVNGLMGGWCLVQAWLVPENPSLEKQRGETKGTGAREPFSDGAGD